MKSDMTWPENYQTTRKYRNKLKQLKKEGALT